MTNPYKYLKIRTNPVKLIRLNLIVSSTLTAHLLHSALYCLAAYKAQF
jgi:hypothetical protein